jgi:hypothetical protein
MCPCALLVLLSLVLVLLDLKLLLDLRCVSSGVKVAEEREDFFAIFAIPERRTDALRKLWNLRYDEAGLFLLS